ncbi:DUF4360 domain-containing protein [Actinomadura decatromicini]|uniref:DUF4360 domain-containing protein n=1 Tax=Actinomadura decatromicini TaxID=2604572 RepID=UPI0016530147|nr:DUF4360 domain-containing protein [Actinomadura decatromicini]
MTFEIANLVGPMGCQLSGYALGADATAFTVTYSRYQARAGGGSPSAGRWMRCVTALRIHPPSGYTYGLERTDYRGSADLAAGATGTLKARSYFPDRADLPVRDILALNGPYSGNWTAADETLPDQVVYQPCGEIRSLFLHSELAVDSGSSDPSKVSVMSMDGADGSLKATYHFAWKTCPK